ncbi:Glycosyl transferase, family 2 (fragment) [Planktothrix sp. PCC 11201]|uniref:glycosyltransferase n=1 Tax=Planktothrix sp. PCC 11201 TaxID=1729650 RepID=UPI00091BD195
MPNSLETEKIKLSVIIPFWQQGDFLLDIIRSLEYNLEISYEFIVLVNRNLLDFELADILNYLNLQEHQILYFEPAFNSQDIFNQAIAQARGNYIVWLQYPVILYPKGLAEAINILDNNLEVDGVNQIQQFIDFEDEREGVKIGSVFRKAIWETEIILKTRFLEETGFLGFRNSQKDLIINQLSEKICEVKFNYSFNPELPLVSVCIPSYNGEKFIAEAISSILSQTYSAIELIISDDHSSDNTIAIAQSFKNQTSIPINILTHQTLGLAENSNFCINQSQGKYIKFVYQDDILMPNCIEKMVDLAETDPDIGLVFSPREMFFLEQENINLELIAVYQQFANLHQSWSNLKSIQWGKELLNDPNLWQHPINKIGEPSTVLLRKSLFKTVAGFDPQLNQLVDLDLWWRILAQFKVGFVEETLSYFRLHTQQKTCQNMFEGQANDQNFYDKIYSHPDYQLFPPQFRASSGIDL